MLHVAKVMSVMLDNSCSCPWYPENKNLEPGSAPGGHLGWNIHRFDLCCVSYEVIARKRNGKWQVKKYSVLGMDE